MSKKATTTKRAPHSTNMFFDHNDLLPLLYGDDDLHLKKIEKMLNVETVVRGNMLSITGNQREVALSERILNELYEKLAAGQDIGPAEVDAAIRMAPPVSESEVGKLHGAPSDGKRKPIGGDVAIRTLKKTIRPYSHMQDSYIRALFDNDLVFALGPAGTGKTFITMAMGIYQYINGKVERIILSRPAVEAGEKIGFLPGDIKEKFDPFLRPLYDALFDMMPAEKVNMMQENGEIEVAPLAYMRGRTISNAFVILDEAQNTTPTQMKMFLTRLGENSRMVITGDLSQIDLPKDVKSGLRDCIRKIEHIEGIEVLRFSDGDVVRHPLAGKIVRAYNDWDSGIRPQDARHQDADADAEEGEEEGLAGY